MDYTTLASKETVDKTIEGLKRRNVEGIFVSNKEEALAKIKEWIPAGASVMNGASVTLEEIGFVDYLKSASHPWNNLHLKVLEEKDPAKQKALRRAAAVSDYYLGSVHALAETGEMVIASNTGSQMPHIVFTSENIIFVVGAQKIVPTVEAGQERLRKYVVPLEDKHMQDLYKMGTNLSKELIFHFESPFNGRKIRMIIVNEKLGF